MSKAILAVMLAALLSGAACEKKPAKAGDTGAINAMDRIGSDQGPVDTKPLEGIDVTKLSKEKQDLFYKLIGSLSSPCGKAHSLRTSYASDTACKRAPFAARYLVAILEDEGTEAMAREEYSKKYAEPKTVKLNVSKAPHIGNDDAAIRLVEFFDYQCPHCAAFRPMLDSVLASREGKVVAYYMMFPLDKHHDSKSAAKAAIAAGQLGKFKEMHEILFTRSPAHSREAVMSYAKELGIDLGAFTTAYDAADAQVASDLAQGDTVGVEATPTVYFNDRKYEGPMHPKYIEMWIDEELAVNR